jgi:exoenzyme U
LAVFLLFLLLLVGADLTSSEKFMLSQMGKKFSRDVVTVPLRFDGKDYMGMLSGTLKFNMTIDEKKALQEQLENVTDAHLESRSKRHAEAAFNNIEQLLLSLSDEALEIMAAHADN